MAVDAGDVEPTGTVTAFAGDEELDSATLSDGEAELKVGPFGRTLA